MVMSVVVLIVVAEFVGTDRPTTACGGGAVG